AGGRPGRAVLCRHPACPGAGPPASAGQVQGAHQRRGRGQRPPESRLLRRGEGQMVAPDGGRPMLRNCCDAWSFRTTALVLLLGLVAVAGSHADEPKQPADLEKVLGDWKGRQASLAGVRYEVSGRGLVAKGQFSGDPALPLALRKQTIPPEDYTYQKKLIWLVD